MIELDEAEWAARRMRYAQLKAAVPDLDQQMEDVARVRAEGTPEFQEILETFIRSGDAAELRFAMDSWSRRHRTFGFGGANGQMLLNQLVNDDVEGFVANRLRRLIQLPDGDHTAAGAFEELVEHITVLREGGSRAAIGSVPAFLSWWWWMQSDEAWPVAFSSATSRLAELGFVDPEAPQWERYLAFRAHVQQFGTWREVERVLREVSPSDVGLDPSAVTRCGDIARRGVRPGEPDYDVNRAAVGVMRAMAKELGGRLAPIVSEILEVPVTHTVPAEYWNGDTKRIREDIWISWRPQREAPQPFLQLVIDADGVKLGLYPSFQQTGGKGYPAHVREVLEGADGVAHLQWIPWGTTYSDPASERMYSLFGTTLDVEDLLAAEGLEQALRMAVESLEPAFQALWDQAEPQAPPPLHPGADFGLPDLRTAFV